MFLSELLRRTAEHALKDMVLLLFMRLPQFAEELQQFNIKKIKMHSSALEQNTKKRKSIPAKLEKPVIPKINTIQSSPQPEELLSPNPNQLKAPPLATTPATPGCNIVDMQGRISQTPQGIHESHSGESQQLIEEEIVEETSEETDTAEGVIDTIESELESPEDDSTNKEDEGEYINSMGVRFTPQTGGGYLFWDSVFFLLKYFSFCFQNRQLICCYLTDYPAFENFSVSSSHCVIQWINRTLIQWFIWD